MNSELVRQRHRHDEGSGSREGDLADDARASGWSATSIATSRRADTGYSFNETPSTAWTRTQTAPTPGVAYTATHLEPNAARRSLLGLLRQRDRAIRRIRANRCTQAAHSRTARPATSAAATITGTRTTPTGPPPPRSCRTMRTGSSAPSRISTSACSITRRASRVYAATTISSTPISSTARSYGYGNVRQPFSYAAQIRNIGAFVDDSIRLGDRVTLNVGVRADYSNALCAGSSRSSTRTRSRPARRFRAPTSSPGTASHRASA